VFNHTTNKKQNLKVRLMNFLNIIFQKAINLDFFKPIF